jgi:hypothetical protein
MSDLPQWRRRSPLSAQSRNAEPAIYPFIDRECFPPNRCRPKADIASVSSLWLPDEVKIETEQEEDEMDWSGHRCCDRLGVKASVEGTRRQASGPRIQ